MYQKGRCHHTLAAAGIVAASIAPIIEPTAVSITCGTTWPGFGGCLAAEADASASASGRNTGGGAFFAGFGFGIAATVAANPFGCGGGAFLKGGKAVDTALPNGATNTGGGGLGPGTGAQPQTSVHHNHGLRRTIKATSPLACRMFNPSCGLNGV